MAVFFQANAYYQIKTNEDMTHPESASFRTLDKLEADGYERAKNLRREILQDVSRPRYVIIPNARAPSNRDGR